MSVVFVVVPLVTGGFPALASLAAAAAAGLGLGLARLSATGARHEAIAPERVELGLDGVEGLAEAVGLDEQVAFGDDRLRIVVRRDARGRASVCAEGTGLSRRALEEAGRAFAARMVQQYAYQKVVGELQAQGFEIVTEEAAADRSIRVRFRKG